MKQLQIQVPLGAQSDVDSHVPGKQYQTEQSKLQNSVPLSENTNRHLNFASQTKNFTKIGVLEKIDEQSNYAFTTSR